MCTRLHKYRVMRRLQLPHAHVLELEDGSFPKESIKKYMDELTESARIIGAVNTAVFPAAILEHHGAPWSTTALGETGLCGKLKEIEQPQPTSQGDKEEGAVFRRQHCLHLKVILSVVKCHTLASFHIACFQCFQVWCRSHQGLDWNQESGGNANGTTRPPKTIEAQRCCCFSLNMKAAWKKVL